MSKNQIFSFSHFLGCALLISISATCFSNAGMVNYRVVEVFSGNTFKVDNGTVVRAVYQDRENDLFDIVCNEQKALQVAKANLYQKRVFVKKYGVDYAGTTLAKIIVKHQDYVELLKKQNACVIEEIPLTVYRREASKWTVNGEFNVSPLTRYSSDVSGKRPEAYWQHAFNELYANGATEVSVEGGRADIVTKNYAIEVDRIQKWHESIGQALHYSKETGKQPGIALFNDGSRDFTAKYNQAKEIAEEQGIKVWLINDHVPSNYTLRSTGFEEAAIPGSWMASGASSARKLRRGPRGGVYYFNSSGNKQYVDRSLWNGE